MKLQIAKDLALPIDAVTQTFGILGKRGGGKSYTAKVMAEEMLRAKAHIACVDPIGNWWGLRVSADGKSPGLPITVMGGEYGDIPIEPTEKAGEIVARLIIEEKISVVVDLSLFRKGEQITFMIGWAEALYRLNREALHVFIDEADAFAPQRPVGNLAPRLLGAMEDLVRRGRARGLGMTIITQRSASINKDLLTQIEVLIAKRTIAPQDRAAIDAWIEVHGTPEQQKTMMQSLPSLPKEAAWIWSPGWLDLFQLVSIRKLLTMDSSATPEVGRRTIEPRRLAEVDLVKVRERMAATIERAKADDPRELRKRIAELEKALKKPASSPAPAKADPASRDALERAEQRGAAQVRRQAAKEFGAIMRPLRKVIQQSIVNLRLAAADLERVEPPDNLSLSTAVDLPPEPDPPAARPGPPPRGRGIPDFIGDRRQTTQSEPRKKAEGTAISRPQQAILDGLAWLEVIGIDKAARNIAGFLAGASPRSSAFTNNLGALRTAELIDYPGQGLVALTDAGRDMANRPAAPPTSEQLHQTIYQRLPRPQAAILEALIAAYPKSLSRQETADQAGASPTSSAFTNNLGALRSIGLIDYPAQGQVEALPLLFLTG